MSGLLYSVLGFVVGLGALIAVHEYGHFLAARKLGVRVLRFSIGFGPAIWKKVGKDGVEYVIAAVPLGGYVKMLGESAEDAALLAALPEQERARAFDRQPVWKRAVIAAAGPAFNFLFAIAAYAVVAWIGMPAHPAEVGAVLPKSAAADAGIDPGVQIVAVNDERVRSWEELVEALRAARGSTFVVLELDDGRRLRLRWPKVADATQAIVAPARVLGIAPPVAVVVVQVRAGMPAARAGMQSGDEIVAVNGRLVASAGDVARAVEASEGRTLSFRVRRGDRKLVLQVAPQREGKHWRIGIALGERWLREGFTVRKGPIEGVIYGLVQTWRMSVLTVETIGKMLSRAISPENLGGPITIAQLSGRAAEAGLVAFLAFLALISVNLGVLNLVPLPVLDGGHLMLLAVEAVRGRPLSPRVLAWVQGFGIVLIVALMAFALSNDLARLLRGG